ncbi:signal transduction histidine kinase [Ornithinimicrobium humiphilum]|uniref:Oxygen sensor histidine kinase NreB n=1 Tax=Ornithinimicrobium humiphilum TaxID=125288 RepID=A0A543KNV7_9MICO|nr:sensor histidine kinase [Ornithinimicrobium humiphilum]TQM96744.1 signal transduction histidine kinase [Ornithinimicrobium humiphilum]
MTSTTGSPDRHRRAWERWNPYVPFAMLAVATVVALPTGSIFGTGTPRWLLVQAVLVAVTALWSWWWTMRRPEWRADRRRMAVHVVGRTALAFVLTWINPFFALFAWVGFLDVGDAFTGWPRRAVLLVVAATVAGSQSGGLPPSGAAQTLVLAVLVVLHVGLFTFFGNVQQELDRRSADQAAAITELERLNADLERALAENARLHETVVEQARRAGVQEERQRLAREIHDTIAQSLAGVLAQLRAAQVEPDPRARLDRAADLAQEALAEARRSVMDLSPAPLTGSADLAEAVTRLVHRWDEEHRAAAEVHVTGDLRPLHPEVEATVLRVTQEALSNVAKHASATRVGVTLALDDEEVLLDVRDDGVGFDLDAERAPTSFGLRGMRQRAERLAGALEVETQPGQGTAVSLRLPALAREVAA